MIKSDDWVQGHIQLTPDIPFLPGSPYMDQICQMVALMLDSGLPCFKGETIKRLKSRFQPEKSERAAAKFMMARIRESAENRRTVWYDAFQKATNGMHLYLRGGRKREVKKFPHN